MCAGIPSGWSRTDLLSRKDDWKPRRVRCAFNVTGSEVDESLSPRWCSAGSFVLRLSAGFLIVS